MGDVAFARLAHAQPERTRQSPSGRDEAIDALGHGRRHWRQRRSASARLWFRLLASLIAAAKAPTATSATRTTIGSTAFQFICSSALPDRSVSGYRGHCHAGAAVSGNRVIHLGNKLQDGTAFPGSKRCIGVGFIVELDPCNVTRGGLPTLEEPDQCFRKFRINPFQPTECRVGRALKRLLRGIDVGRQLGERA